VERLGLPPHSEPTKNWDSLAALACILERTKREARILDAGAELYSVILPWLCLYGYRDLHGINIVFDSVIQRGPITYDYGDVTETRFDDCSFDVITCLSVIEHGVDAEKFFPEMHRILKPGGVLVISVDYFETPVDTRGREAYGGPVHIYTREQITWMTDIAADIGLKLIGPLDLHTGKKIVRWEKMDLDYTYLFFVMEKITGSIQDEIR
jgi:SAM-dependent methyltransferase